MALVKRAGEYYYGDSQSVAASSGDKTKDMTHGQGLLLQSLMMMPDAEGSTDVFKVEILNADSSTKRTLGTNINNLGQNIAITLNFKGGQLISSTETLRVTYANTSATAKTIYYICEYMGKSN